MRRRGFTLIEMLVVVALISILGSLLVIGIGKLQTNSKRQQTRLIFQNLQAMFADYDVNHRVPLGMGNFAGFNNLPQTGPAPSQQTILADLVMYCPQNVALDYNSAMEAGTMPASGSTVTSADRKGLDGNTVVPITRSFVAQWMSTTNNAASIGKLPSSALMTYAGFDAFAPPPTYWSAGTVYPVGAFVEDNPVSQNIFIRTQLKLDTSGNLVGDLAGDGPPNYYYWMPALRVSNPTVLPSPPGSQGTPLPTPVILDAWGDPIIFVPGGVLGANPSPQYIPPAYTLVADSHGNLVPPVGSGGMITNYGPASAETQVHSPDYHPFFASAGPDGDFSKGDDNLYSFEK